jgi:hypothetical protein
MARMRVALAPEAEAESFGFLARQVNEQRMSNPLRTASAGSQPGHKASAKACVAGDCCCRYTR